MRLGIIATLLSALVGAATSTFGSVLAATDGTEVGTWLAGGGSAAAVAGLAYIAKRLASGDLVAIRVDKLLKDGEVRETRLEALVTEGRAREDALRDLLLNRRPAPGASS